VVSGKWLVLESILNAKKNIYIYKIYKKHFSTQKYFSKPTTYHLPLTVSRQKSFSDSLAERLLGLSPSAGFLKKCSKMLGGLFLLWKCFKRLKTHFSGHRT
jgi:hypothetical protein